MNKILTFTIIILISLFILFFAYRLTKSSVTAPYDSHNKTLAVSILPVKYIVNSIVGDDFEITVLVPPGSSPEIYEPTPYQLMSISNAMLIFNVGLLDFEQELMKRFPANMKNKIVDLSSGVNLLKGSCSGLNGNHHNHGVDPHIWTSPKQLKIMTERAYSAISSLYPDSVKYKDNYGILISRLDELDKKISESIENSNTKYFFIYHPALTYYANDYGIEQVSIEREGKEPSAEQLKNLIKLARNENIDMVMYQREFSRNTVETIAGDIGAKAIMIDPLAEDIINSISNITEIITKRNFEK